jgi:F0F1-type ATP synthase membrane subunit a
MQSVIKIFLLAATLFVAAFFANYFGLVSIPWLDLNSVPTYSEDAIHMDDTLKKVFKE